MAKKTKKSKKKKEKKKGNKKNTRRKKVKAVFSRERIVTEDSSEARELYNQSRYGKLLDNGKLQLSLLEGSYLLEKGRLKVVDGRGKKLDFDSYVRKAKRKEKNFWIRYVVFKDIRDRGYIIKTALKFGADFRVYNRGIKPGEDHARWIVYPVHETSTLTWHEFSAKNRVAHSTRKKLLIGVVDAENDVTYYEIKWIRP